MTNENQKTSDDDDLDIYADGSITSADAKVPRWLKWVYVVLPIWGVLWFFMYCNGSSGWLDRGYWGELQKAANTTTPYFNDISPLESTKGS